MNKGLPEPSGFNVLKEPKKKFGISFRKFKIKDNFNKLYQLILLLKLVNFTWNGNCTTKFGCIVSNEFASIIYNSPTSTYKTSTSLSNITII